MNWRLIRQIGEQILREATPATSTFDPRNGCFGPQLRFINDMSEQRVVCTSRRAGKTSAIVRDALWESWKHPNSTVVYLNETRSRAERTFWEELKRVALTAGLPYVANESDLCLRGPENRWIWVSGGETKKHVSRWKGVLPRVAAFYLDEAQDWRSEVLAHAYTEVAAPALADIGGRFTVSGVPGPLPDLEDTWFGWTQNSEFSQHGGDENPWTIWDNPHVHEARKLLERVCRTRLVDESDPTIQREFFGRWVRDNQILVFGALDDELNAYDVLPEGDWSFAAGIDFGFVDSSSINVLGWLGTGDPHIFVTRNDEFAETGAYETIDKVKDAFVPLGARLQAAVADPAAGGKNICDDLWTRHGLSVEPATKEDKVGGIKLLASSIASRELLIPRHHKLFRELRRVQWDPDHRGEKLHGHTPDRVDALLYAFRAAYPIYTNRPQQPIPSYEEERLRRILEKQN